MVNITIEFIKKTDYIGQLSWWWLKFNATKITLANLESAWKGDQEHVIRIVKHSKCVGDDHWQSALRIHLYEDMIVEQWNVKKSHFIYLLEQLIRTSYIWLTCFGKDDW